MLAGDRPLPGQRQQAGQSLGRGVDTNWQPQGLANHLLRHPEAVAGGDHHPLGTGRPPPGGPRCNDEDNVMPDNDKEPTDRETVLMALDQISQTIDVMSSVVGRLRHYLEEQEAKAADPAQELAKEMEGDRILH